MGTIVRGVKSATGTINFGASTKAKSAEVNTDLNTVYSAINGNLDNDNVAASAGIEASKLDLSTISQDITINGSLVVTGGISGTSFQAGMVIQFAGITAPTGSWLTCDGQAINRVTYADLYTAIGTTYGVGDGFNTFNVPDIEGKVVVGQDTTQTEFDTLGETGGSKTVDDRHTHSLTDVSATLSWSAGEQATGPAARATEVNGMTASSGGSASLATMPPYIVMKYYIRY